MTHSPSQFPLEEDAGLDRPNLGAFPRRETPAGDEACGVNSSIVIPVAAESLTVSRRVVETGRGVRVLKTVSEREELVDEPLSMDEVLVERTEVDRLLADGAEAPSMRQEGDVTIVPVLEEVLVTQKRLLLKAEVRITRVRHEVHQPQRVMLRTEQVSVERFDDGKEPAGPDGKSD